MQYELDEFEWNKFWRLIPKHNDTLIVSLKWVLKNKMDKEGNIARNKSSLVVKVIINKREMIMKKPSPLSRESILYEFL